MDVYNRVQRLLESDSSSVSLRDAVAQGMDVVARTLSLYKPSELAFAFNGGKDSTVVFHLIRAVVAQRAAESASADTLAFSGIRLVIFETPNNFPDVEQFIDATAASYVLDPTIPCHYHPHHAPITSLVSIPSGNIAAAEERVQHQSSCVALSREPRGTGWLAVLGSSPDHFTRFM